MKTADHTSAPCSCLDCRGAGITDRPTVRDPVTGAWLHGYKLAKYWRESDAALDRIRERLAIRRTGDSHARDE
jgi:hypothetical protein